MISRYGFPTRTTVLILLVLSTSEAAEGHDVDGFVEKTQDKDGGENGQGIETAMMMVLRQVPTKRRIINPVNAPAMMPSRTTPLIALRTKTD